MHMKTRMPGEPVLDGLRLVGAVVVHHEMDVQRRRYVGFDGEQELQELAAAMAAVQIADDSSGGDIQRGEQGGRAMALVVMGAPLGDAGSQGKRACPNFRVRG